VLSICSVRQTLATQKRPPRTLDRAQERRQLEAARKREGILEASGRAFARGGYHATTMQDIAREAGYTPPSLYAYFDSKEQIFLELAALLSREFTSVFDEPLSAKLSLRERLEQLLRQLFEKADRYHHAVTVFLIGGVAGEAMITRDDRHASPPSATLGTGFSSVQLFVMWLRKNAKRAELGGNRPEELGVALAGLVTAFCIQWLSAGAKTDVATEVARVTSMFLHGALGERTR
jgi:AcrR family transcriptional regulator